MSLVYIRSFLCRFVLRLYEKTGQAWKYHYQFKCNHKYIKKHELFFFLIHFFRHHVLNSMTPVVWSGCQENLFDQIWLDNKAVMVLLYQNFMMVCSHLSKWTRILVLKQTSANQPGWTVTHCRQCLMTYHLHSLGPALEVESHLFWGWYVEDWPAASWMRCCYYPF